MKKRNIAIILVLLLVFSYAGVLGYSDDENGNPVAEKNSPVMTNGSLAEGFPDVNQAGEQSGEESNESFVPEEAVFPEESESISEFNDQPQTDEGAAHIKENAAEKSEYTSTYEIVSQRDNAKGATAEPTNNYYFDVTDFGANGTDTTDDYRAFKMALDQAKSADQTITVHIPTGTYYLSSGLGIYSDTVIKADSGAIMLCDIEGAGNMLYGVHFDSDGSVCTGLGSNYASCDRKLYNHEHNITIDGGTWNRNCASTCNSGLLTIIHSHDITIRNATFMNSTNHMLNLSGCKNVNITNCTFKNMIKYTGTDKSFWGSTSKSNAVEKKKRYAQLEAVHLDFLTSEGESGKYPLDGTPCVNISISNCTFSNVGAGAGTHNTYVNNKSKYPNCGKGSNLKITNCTFNNVWGHMANFYSYVNSYLISDGRTTKNTSSICRIVGSSATVSGINITGIDGDIGPTIYVSESSTAMLNKITIDGGTNTGSNNSLVFADNSSAVTASNLTLKNGNTGKPAIAAVNSSCLTLNKGNIKSTKQVAILAKKAKKLAVSATTISGCKDNGIVAESSSGITLKSNTITSAKKNGIYLKGCSNVTISGNKIKSSKISGIYQHTTKKTTISKNTINGSGSIGIYVVGTSKKKVSTATISKNTVKSKRSKYAIFLKGYCKSCKVKSNKVGGKGYASASKYKVKASGNKKIK